MLQYKECVPHFQQSVETNSLQEDVWTRLAFSAMELEEWGIAAEAYRRYCSLNSEVSVPFLFSIDCLIVFI